MTPHGLFVTATGTDIGKTHASCALIRARLAAGKPIAALKPVASGFDPGDLGSSDAGRLLAAMGREPTLHAIAAINPWRFAAPLSPDMAAQREGAALPFAEVRAWCERKLEESEAGFTLVEGAGGVMSPIAEDGLVIDLAASLALPVALLAGGYVGTISHTLTALSALHEAGCAVAAVVLNAPPGAPGPPIEETREALRRHGRDLPAVFTLDEAIAEWTHV